jgi:UDP-N-acetylmuramyl pentapeptide synthase
MLIKLIFLFKKPKIIVVFGKGRQTAAEAIFKVLGREFRVGKTKKPSLKDIVRNQIVILEAEERGREFAFFLKRSKKAVLVVTHFGDYHPDKEFFAAELSELTEVSGLVELLSDRSHLILNYDDETVRELKSKSRAAFLTFGFGARADLRVTDIFLTKEISPGTNFKLNYRGKIVPIWLKNLFGKEQVYASLAAAACGLVMGA